MQSRSETIRVPNAGLKHSQSVSGRQERSRAAPWLMRGAVAGVTGAAVVALFFLTVDLLNGRPLWTPSMLGARLFLNEGRDVGADPSAALVAGYTLVHGAVFLGLGLIAAIAVGDQTTRPRPLTTLVAGAGIFLGVEVFFLTVTGAFAPELIAAIGSGRVAAANALAAIGMTAVFVWDPVGRLRESGERGDV